MPSSREFTRTAAGIAATAVIFSVAGCAAGDQAGSVANETPVAQFTPAAPPAGVYDQATFFYYTDLESPRHFYGSVLGLAPYYETEWVTLYRTSPGATLGLIKAPDDRVPAEAKRDAAMVSLVTLDVDSWYRKLQGAAGITIQKPLYDHPAVPIRAFLIRDPAGYSVEFFEWRKH